MTLLDTKWPTLVCGCSILGLALALPERTLARNIGQPIFLLGMLLFLDGMMSFRVMDYATIRGPEERREVLERLFYSYPRAKKRYALAVLMFIVALTAVMAVPFGDWYLFLMIGAVSVYGIVLMVELFRCRSIAGKAT